MPDEDPPRGSFATTLESQITNSGTTFDSSSGGYSYLSDVYVLLAGSGTKPNKLKWLSVKQVDVGSHDNVVVKMSQATYDVMHGGTYSGQIVTYQSTNYEVRLENVNGVAHAIAYTV